MNPTPLPPVPISKTRRLRRLRERTLPVSVFVVVWASIFLLWREEVAPLAIVGEVEVVKTDIMPPETGTLKSIEVEPFQQVEAGAVIAILARCDPADLAASIGVIQAELDLLTTNLDPLIGKQRAELDYERLRLELTNQRLQQARDKLALEQARLDLQRSESLRSQGVLAEVDQDRARLAHELLATAVQNRAADITHLESTLARLAFSDSGPRSRQDALEAAARVQERRIEELEARMGPLTILAPIGGRVGLLLRRPGESVQAGEIITTITAESGERIVGYLRPPLRQDVTPGTRVLLRCRSGKRTSVTAVIDQVNAHYSPLPPELQEAGSRIPERALAFSVKIPAAFPARPGEFVDLSLLQ